LRFNSLRLCHLVPVRVLGNAHTNTFEGFLSLCKNCIRGVFHSISPKYLQAYLNEYALRYNHRNDETPMFFILLQRLALQGAQFS